MLKFVDKVFESSALDADDVADAAYVSMQKNELICNPHPVGRRAYFVKRFLPWIYRNQIGKMAEALKKREERRK
jgi:hypothetical protein